MSGPAGPDASERFEHLWAVHEIQQLVYRYALAFDMRDRDALLGLWAPSVGSVEFPEMDLETVKRVIDRFFALGPSQLLVGNVVVELEDRDHGRGYVYCWPQFEHEGVMVDQAVVYRDAYIRHEGKWRFQTRRHILRYGQARLHNPYAQPPADWPHSQIGSGVQQF